MFDARTCIREKRDGKRHLPGVLRELIQAFATGEVPDYQMAAWLMAAYLRGLDEAETFDLTQAMLHSGRVLELRGTPTPPVDKHSTGGVGDKVSLPLAPLAAVCGAFVPMISGRGLGHTGGTLDKLESIPGFVTRLDPERLLEQVREIGVAFGGQTDDIAPADRGLYALRDVTATVESIPLIVSSILSKKFASGARAVAFDVKTGRGAFMRDPEDARRLALALLAISARLDRRATALVTDMDQPLGLAVGNALEVAESIEILRGRGPADVRELVLALAVEMLLLAGIDDRPEAARDRATRALDSGAALERFRAMVRAQGGSVAAVDDPARLPRAARIVPVESERSGFVTGIDAYEVGEVVVLLGGGRQRKEDAVDPAVGVVLEKKRGDRVEVGEVLARVHAHPGMEEELVGVRARILLAYEMGPLSPPPAGLIVERLEQRQGRKGTGAG